MHSPCLPLVVCVRWGTKYPPDYVFRLKAMVARHLAMPHEFLCLTDQPAELEGRVAARRLSVAGLESCWTKLEIFCGGLAAVGRPVLYLDLDVVVTGALDDLFSERAEQDFLGVMDWNRWFPQINSSVMRFAAGAHAAILEDFRLRVAGGRLRLYREWDACLGSRDKVVYRSGIMRFGGDQEWISRCLKKGGALQGRCFPRAWIKSFKSHARSAPPPDCRIVVFHGQPKPHEVVDSWVGKQWG